jgi:hypothetical protein
MRGSTARTPVTGAAFALGWTHAARVAIRNAVADTKAQQMSIPARSWFWPTLRCATRCWCAVKRREPREVEVLPAGVSQRPGRS